MVVSGRWSVVSGWSSVVGSPLLRASARRLRATSHFPLRFLHGFGSLSHSTNVRQPAPPPIWERAGGEGRQGRLLGSVAHAHTSTWLQHERRAGFGGVYSTPSSPRRVGVLDKESSTKRSRAFLGWHRTHCWPPQGLPILSPEWGGNHIAQRRKPWELRAHQHPTAPNGATEFTGTSNSSARYGAVQPKCFCDPQGLRHWAKLAVAPFGALVASPSGGSTHTSTGLSMSGGRGSRWSVVSGEFPALSSFHSSHLTLHSSLWLPLPPDQCQATSTATHLGEGGG